MKTAWGNHCHCKVYIINQVQIQRFVTTITYCCPCVSGWSISASWFMLILALRMKRGRVYLWAFSCWWQRHRNADRNMPCLLRTHLDNVTPFCSHSLGQSKSPNKLNINGQGNTLCLMWPWWLTLQKLVWRRGQIIVTSKSVWGNNINDHTAFSCALCPGYPVLLRLIKHHLYPNYSLCLKLFPLTFLPLR